MSFRRIHHQIKDLVVECQVNTPLFHSETVSIQYNPGVLLSHEKTTRWLAGLLQLRHAQDFGINGEILVDKYNSININNLSYT